MPYKRKRQDDQQHKNSRKQYHYTEGTAQVRLESDIPKSQRAHYGKCPIKTGNPGVVLAFQFHNKMEKNGVNYNDYT